MNCFDGYCERCANRRSEKCKNCWQKEPSQFVGIPERKFIDFGKTEIKKRGK